MSYETTQQALFFLGVAWPASLLRCSERRAEFCLFFGGPRMTRMLFIVSSSSPTVGWRVLCFHSPSTTNLNSWVPAGTGVTTDHIPPGKIGKTRTKRVTHKKQSNRSVRSHCPTGTCKQRHERGVIQEITDSLEYCFLMQ